MSQYHSIQSEDLKNYLPHRGINLLIDKVTQTDEQTGELCLLLNQNDPAGRDIFLEHEQSQFFYNPHLFAEFLALGATVLLKELPAGYIALFASISNFTVTERLIEGDRLYGNIVRQKDRGPLKRFSGILSHNGVDQIGSCDITAYTMNMAEERNEEKKRIEPPAITLQEKIPPNIFTWKNPSMVFVHTVTDFQSQPYSITTRYTYPDDHPFTPGHFPDNPVMMGITQWMMVADTICTLIWKSRNSLPHTRYDVSADSFIFKEDGTLVSEAKKVAMRMDMADTHHNGYPILTATQKIVFRDMVKPGETIYCLLNNVNIKPLFNLY
ncbi:MAG: hypothetical protein Q8Q33_08715 [Chlamydiota bacterium]|nr:hypothetical protein [Chlamydiota bacterium]